MESWGSGIAGNLVSSAAFFIPTVEGIGRSQGGGAGDGSAISLIAGWGGKSGDVILSLWNRNGR